MTEQPIVIIGAGIGGLSAAIRLAANGKKVIIVEKNPLPGGKMYQIEDSGYRWDTGPSVITMRHVFEDLFATAGRNLEDYIQLQPVEPLTRYFYRDGTILDASADMSKMANAIEAIEPRDVEGYLAYLAYAARIHRITGPVFIYDRPPQITSFARVPPTDWLKVDPFRTMNQSIKRFVRSPHLRKLLGRFATYVGGSPFEAPATLNVIAHVELTGGIWYPKGGIYTIATGMVRLAEELGVEICLGNGASSITLDGDKVSGVTLEDGTTITTETIIANVDVTTTYKHLLPKTPAISKRLETLQNYEPSCSGFVLLLGTSKTFPELAHHNIFWSDDYEAEFKAIFKDQVPAKDPTIYITATSKADPEHAPENGENWFILVNAPPTTKHIDWTVEAPKYRDLVLDRLAANGVDVRDHIRVEKILTPVDLEAMSGAWRGALYGPSANSKWTAFRRPHNRSKTVQGLYFAGGTTHPGGGVPMVTLSGKVAAEFVLEDLA